MALDDAGSVPEATAILGRKEHRGPIMVASVDQLDALLRPSGQRLLASLPPGVLSGGEALRLGTALRREYPAELVAAALTLHALRVLAAPKFSRAAEMYLTRDGLEQASGEIVARHRVDRFVAAEKIADLCCGIGGDLIALVERGGEAVIAVDQNELHLRMATLNAAAYGVAERVEPLLGRVQDIDLRGISAAFIDPTRRAAGRRLGAASEPPLNWCFGLSERIGCVAVKAAPGLALEVVPAGWEIEFVAVGRELKEALLWSPAFASVERRATVLPGGDELVSGGRETVPMALPGAYLLDPNPAVTRAGLVEALAVRLNAWKIDERIAFLSSDAPMRTPFGRSLRIVESMPWHLKRIGERLRKMDVGAVDIRRRGLAGDVEEVRRRLRLAGRRRVTLAMTRMRDQPWCLVCQDLDEDDRAV